MAIVIDAIYEDGVLKPDQALPIAEHERVKVVIETQTTVSRQSYGLLGWSGDPETLRKIALEPEYGVQECP